MNTSKRYYGEWKRQSQKIVLKSANKFRASSKFRERIGQIVADPHNQLELHISSHTCNVFKRVDLGSLFKRFGAVVPGSIHFEYCKLINLTSFPPMSKISFRCCRIEGNDKRLDVARLGILEEASFISMDPENYHLLSHLKSVSISCTDSITDVSCFRNVPTLKLSSCQKVSDVSSLENVVDLSLSFCAGLANISGLAKLQVLKLESCRTVKDLSALKYLRELHLVRFEGNDLSHLPKLVKLILFDCQYVKDITMLKNLKQMQVSYCDRLQRFHGLDNLKDLCIGDAFTETTRLIVVTGTRVFSNLRSLKALGMKFSDEEENSESNLEDETTPFNLSWNHIRNVRYLTLYKCKLDEFPESFTHLHSLTICRCRDFTFLPALPHLGYLEIEECAKLKQLQLSGSGGGRGGEGDEKKEGSFKEVPLYSVKIIQCTGLTEIHVFRKVCHLIVENCEKLSSLLATNCEIEYVKSKYCSKLTVGTDLVLRHESYDVEANNYLSLYEDD
jgi:hypothetical protein